MQVPLPATKGALTRRALIGATTVAGAAAAAACATLGTSSTTGGVGAAPTLRAGTTVTWMVTAGLPVQEDARTQQIAAFQQQNPGVRVNVQPTAGGEFTTKLLAAFSAGTPPDLYFTQATSVPNQVVTKLVLPLDDLIKRDKYPLTDFYPTSYGQYRVDGKLYALPYDFPNTAFFYNVDAFTQAGLPRPPSTYKDTSWTWEAFRNAALTLQRRYGPQGAFAVDTGRGLRAWIYWLWNAGGDLFSKDGKEIVINQPAGVEGLAFLQDLIYHDGVAPPQQGRQDPTNAFVGGNMFLYWSGQPNVGTLRSRAGSTLRWDVAAVPKGKGPWTTSGGGSAYAMSQGDNREETWALFKHIMSKPMQEINMKASGSMVALKSIIESPEFLQPPPEHMSLFQEGATVLRGDPSAVRWPEINQVLNEEIDKLFANTATAKQVADAVKLRADPLLKG
jgi:multiple sugar transport system substrate-binding protein